ncbi:MAG: signal peptidase I [Bacteroidetes bacterium]|nr:signal peptidase I [Bacteroidota bacterium]
MINRNAMSDENHKSPREHSNRIFSRNPFAAGALNLAAPGLGYFYCGKFSLGIGAAIAFPLLLLSIDFISIVLPEKTNSVFFLCGYIILFLFVLIHSVIIALKNKRYSLKAENKFLYYLVFFALSISYNIYLRECTFETHNISSGSMENTILIRDQVLIRYTYYGFYEPFSEKIIFRFRFPQRNELAVFNGPYKANNSLFLKRITCIPRDTITIVKRQVFVNGVPDKPNDLYKYDKNRRKDTDVNGQLYPHGAEWNEDNYGPLYIPGKGDKIKIDPKNSFIWKPLIIKELAELKTYAEKDKAADEIIRSGEYAVRNNYYFMLGDDRSNSMDSRYIGLIAEDEIIGKAEFVLYNSVREGRAGIILK